MVHKYLTKKKANHSFMPTFKPEHNTHTHSVYKLIVVLLFSVCQLIYNCLFFQHFSHNKIISSKLHFLSAVQTAFSSFCFDFICSCLQIKFNFNYSFFICSTGIDEKPSVSVTRNINV